MTELATTDAGKVVADYLRRWQAAPAGQPFSTVTSVLAPATRDGEPVMLKIATNEEERRGNALMTWWAGRGAAPVLEHDDRAVLLQRAVGPRSLTEWACRSAEDDDAATRELCLAGMRLHGIRDTPPPGPIDLHEWFGELFRHARLVGGFHARAARTARELLAEQRESVVLHGDLHHGNVLDFGAERHPECDGWLVIDPKHLIGDRAFEFTNILCNPTGALAVAPGRLARQVDVICSTTGIQRRRLLRWTVAWCGLSSAWIQRDAANLERAASATGTRTGTAAGWSALEVGKQAERLLAGAS